MKYIEEMTFEQLVDCSVQLAEDVLNETITPEECNATIRAIDWDAKRLRALHERYGQGRL
jgi:hypothetical protein